MKSIALLCSLAALAVACDRAEKKADVPAVVPSAEEILEAHVTAMGGRDAFAKVEAIRVRLEMTIEKYGVRGTVVITQKRPGLSHARTEIEGGGVDEDGCDGTTCWEKSDARGVRLVQGEELHDKLADAKLDSDLRWREEYAKVEVVGAADFAGRPAWKLVLTPSVGAPEIAYYDRKTHFALGNERVIRDQSGQRTVTAKTPEWATYGPIKQPRGGMLTADGVDIRMTVKDLEINPDLPAGYFDLPPEVKALRDGTN